MNSIIDLIIASVTFIIIAFFCSIALFFALTTLIEGFSYFMIGESPSIWLRIKCIAIMFFGVVIGLKMADI